MPEASPYTVDYADVSDEEKRFNLRMCPGCKDGEQWHPLANFSRHQRDERRMILCKECNRKDKLFQMENGLKDAMTRVTEAITKSSKTKSTRLSHAEVIDLMFDGAGGTERAAKLAGYLLKRQIRIALKPDCARADRTLGVSAASLLLMSSASAEKTRPPVDLSEVTQEEWRDILLPCARQLILNDPVFRRELLDITDVRKALLAEADVELLEVASNG